jgi:hypothetical protein
VNNRRVRPHGSSATTSSECESRGQ